MPKGQENVDKTIEICREIMEILDGLDPVEGLDLEGSKEQIRGIMASFEEISGKFFLKSNPSIPLTSACLKKAEGFRGTIRQSEGERDRGKYMEALEGFKKAADSVAQRASMSSTVIT